MGYQRRVHGIAQYSQLNLMDGFSHSQLEMNLFHDTGMLLIIGIFAFVTVINLSQGLALSNGAQTSGGNLLGIELYSSFWETKSFLDNGCQFPDSPAFLSQNILGASGQNNDLCASRCHTDFNTRIAILCQLSGQKLVELSFEEPISDKLLFL